MGVDVDWKIRVTQIFCCVVTGLSGSLSSCKLCSAINSTSRFRDALYKAGNVTPLKAEL